MKAILSLIAVSLLATVSYSVYAAELIEDDLGASPSAKDIWQGTCPITSPAVNILEAWVADKLPRTNMRAFVSVRVKVAGVYGAQQTDPNSGCNTVNCIVPNGDGDDNILNNTPSRMDAVNGSVFQIEVYKTGAIKDNPENYQLLYNCHALPAVPTPLSPPPRHPTSVLTPIQDQ